MNTPQKLAGFAAALAAVFGGAVAAGGAIDPDRGSEDTVMTMHQARTDSSQQGHGRADADAHGGGARGGHAEGGHGHGSAPDGAALRGLSVAQGRLRLIVATPELRRGERAHISFRIERDDGAVVRDFDVEHERRMHLILVRRDLTGFQHLHPEQGADGTWRTTTTVRDPGSYRLFADFSHGGTPFTLAGDVRVDGPANLLDLPAPTAVATSDGDDRVELDAGHAHGEATVHAGRETTLRFAITREGRPVEVEPYLGAGGHLVALREGDLGFLHVHPEGDDLAFTTAFPTPGRYRLFLQYRADGRIDTAAFTLAVER